MRDNFVIITTPGLIRRRPDDEVAVGILQDPRQTNRYGRADRGVGRRNRQTDIVHDALEHDRHRGRAGRVHVDRAGGVGRRTFPSAPVKS